MTSLLEQHPKIQAIREERQKLNEARSASRARVDALMRPYHDALAQRQREQREALLAGKEPPAPPVEPDVGADRDAEHVFMAALEQLRERERRVKAEIAPEIETQAVKAECALLKRAAKIEAEAAALAREWRSLLSDVNACRVARTPGSGSARQVTVEDVLQAGKTGESLLDPRVAAKPVGPIMRDRKPLDKPNMVTNLPSQPDPYQQPRPVVPGARI